MASDLISRAVLLAEYDRIHVGAPEDDDAY